MSFFDSSQKTKQRLPKWIQADVKESLGNFTGAPDPTVYQGDWTAALNPMLSGAWQSMYGNAPGQGIMGQMSQLGGLGMDASSQGMDFIGGLLSGNNGFQFDQGIYDQTMSNLMPGLSAAADKGALDIQKNFDWNVMPGLNLQNAFSGQQGGTKGLQQSALAQSQADSQKQDMMLNLWNNATQQAQNAGMAAGRQNMAGQMNALRGLQSYANMGAGALNNAFNMNQGLLNNQLIAGQGQQGYDQLLADQARAKFDAEAWMPYNISKDRFNTLSNVANAFKTSSTTGSPSGFSNLMSGIGAIGTGFGMLGGLGGMGGGMNLTGMAGGTPYDLTGIGLG